MRRYSCTMMCWLTLKVLLQRKKQMLGPSVHADTSSEKPKYIVSSNHTSIIVSIHPSIFSFIHSSIHSLIHSSIHPSIHLLFHSPFCPSTLPNIHLCISNHRMGKSHTCHIREKYANNYSSDLSRQPSTLV